MAGLVSLTSSRLPGSGYISGFELLWTSNASGDVSGNSVNLPAGTIVGVAFTPGTSGVQPSDQYDVTMTCDSHPAVNVLDDGSGTSVGANLSNANTSHKVPMQGGGAVTYFRQWLHGGGYTLVVANAGASKQGTVTLYMSSGPL